MSGAREEIVSSTIQMMKTLEDGSKNRTTASTCMNSESSRSHGNQLYVELTMCELCAVD